MIQNLLNTGTVFDYSADDNNYAEDLLNLEISDNLEVGENQDPEMDFEDEK